MGTDRINPLIAERTKNTEWFLDARFGMFIHWGLYAIPARGEWVRNNERISNEDYQIYFDEFEPVNYDPGVWAIAAKEAGMKYAVLTAKHHDGFCLFDSKFTNYKSTNTKAGKDLVQAFVEAFRAEGIKVGLYYSLLDWHHEDYPAYSDSIHPMRGNSEYKNKQHNFEGYLDYMHEQIRELCMNYGTIDIMWFDFSYDEMRGEKWRATELINMVRSLQPGIIINNRLEASGEFAGTIKTRNPSVSAGDFASPEQVIPSKGLMDEDGNSIPWEANFTLNNNWGYCSADKSYKTSKQIIRKLVECVSKNGNMLLNVGPNAKGEIPVESLSILKEIGIWMKHNSKSIYHCEKSQFSKPEWGYYTQNGKFLYAHIFDPSIGPLALLGLINKIKKARLISDGSEIKMIKPWNTNDYPDDAFINFGPKGMEEQFTFSLPDDIDTVVELELV
ncbi:alpha-L-fucosidase [Cohnella sp. NL03-T5]|uniref:alpha-L-fucosidase n=2 Tax=Cohnella silvisoli TaxID=2873699 RepID=A0ABV1KR75_9BACL|nr:alpha-L-fucosidase [Cohnella silvisoli]MCD9024646.1 alpha-L-fucosidase [Cohnella silvisoli]